MDKTIQLEWQYQSLEMSAAVSGFEEDGTAKVMAKLKDAEGNPVANQTIQFKTTLELISSSSQTDANGIAEAQLELSAFNTTAHVEAVSAIGGSYGMLSFNRTDTIPPVTTDNAPVEWQNTDVVVTLNASDAGSGVAATYYQINGGEIQTGTTVELTTEREHTLMYWSKAGNVEGQKSVKIKIDKTAPELNVELDITKLWSPNHKLVEITATIESADGLSDVESVVLTSITSNELDYDPGSVDDDVANDIQEAAFGEEDTNFLLRSERSGEGKGRIYTITYTVTDKAGNQTTVASIVEVPHDKENNKEVPKGKKK